MEFIAYENNGLIYSDLVVLSNKPILIKTELSNLSKPPSMFSDHTDDFIIITPQRMVPGITESTITEGMIEGMDTPVYCTPVDDSGVELEASLTIPVLGQYSETLQQSQFIFQTLNFCYAIVIFGVITLATPFIYTYVILRIAGAKNPPADDSEKGKSSAVVMLFAFWFIASAVASISYGGIKSSLLILGIGIFFVFLLMCFIINIFVYHNENISASGGFSALVNFFIDLLSADRAGEIFLYCVVGVLIGLLTNYFSNPDYITLFIIYFLPIVISIYQLSGIKSQGYFKKFTDTVASAVKSEPAPVSAAAPEPGSGPG